MNIIAEILFKLTNNIYPVVTFNNNKMYITKFINGEHIKKRGYTLKDNSVKWLDEINDLNDLKYPNKLDNV